MNNLPGNSASTAPPSVVRDSTGAVPKRTAELFEPKHGFDFRHYWHALIERIWIVVVCVVAGLFLGLGYLARTPKLYQGHIVLEVEFQEPTFVASEEPSSRMRSMFLASQEALRTIEQNLTNRSLMARVVRAEGLADDGGRSLLGQDTGGQNTATPIPRPSSSPKGKAEPMFVGTTFTPLEEALGGAMTGMIKPVIRRGTRLIDLYATNRDPAMAQRLAEAVGREYIRYAIEQRSSFSQGALRYLLEEEERLKANLQRSEAAVAEYKEKTPDALQLGGGAAATGSQAGAGSTGGRGGMVEDKLQELNTKLTGAKSDRIRIENEIKQVEGIGENIDALLAIPSIASSPIVNDRRRDVAQLEAAVGALAGRYKDKHPKMIAARAALTEAREALRRAVLDQPNILRNMLDQARATEASLQAAAHDQEQAALALNKAAIGYQQLARQAETDRALYESVLRQIKETNLTKDVKMTAVSVVEHSPLPRGPVSPSSRKALTLGLLGGLAAGLAFVFGADALDRSVKTVDQAEATFGLPVLAAVPETAEEDKPNRLKRRKKGGAYGYRVVAERPEGPAAEAFRNLRAALSLLGPEAERKITLFTSALPNEGKSFTSANYSVALAQQGYRVLLIDGDLRRPSIHKIFPPNGLQKQAIDSKENVDVPGIVDCLVGEISLTEGARPVSPEQIDIAGEAIAVTGRILTVAGGQLFVLTSGRRAPNPAEILSGPSFANLIAEAAKRFDRVVIDSAPILAVSDTLLMTPYVQTICIVIRASKSPRPAIQRAISLLSGAGTRPAGLVLNRLPKNRGAGYYYYYASPGYGKGEGSYSSSYRGGYAGGAKKNPDAGNGA
jgi:polysaccharide biosynthesis transport protein